MALFFIGVSENDMLQSLYETCAELETGLAEKFGPDVAAMIVEAFAATVIRHRGELEAAGDATPRVLN